MRRRPTRIDIDATPIASFDNRDPTRTRFGDLEFRGGLVLSSNKTAFGGFSGIHVEADGNRFIAITDRGSWLRGRIVYRDGRPAGIADAEIAPMLGSDGKPLATGGWYDAESLAERDGMLYVGIERAEQMVRFDYRRDGLLARGQAIRVPPDFKTFAYNKGLECLAAPRQGSLAGDLIAMTERSLDRGGNIRSFLLGSDKVTRFSVKRTRDFDVSDCALLSPDDLLLLERRYSPVRGVAMRIRRLPLASFKEGAVVDGRSMIEADLAHQIDNMEGSPCIVPATVRQFSRWCQTTISLHPAQSAAAVCGRGGVGFAFRHRPPLSDARPAVKTRMPGTGPGMTK